eukprot:3800082-Prymnesium_polylepis.1
MNQASAGRHQGVSRPSVIHYHPCPGKLLESWDVQREAGGPMPRQRQRQPWTTEACHRGSIPEMARQGRIHRRMLLWSLGFNPGDGVPLLDAPVRDVSNRASLSLDGLERGHGTVHALLDGRIARHRA